MFPYGVSPDLIDLLESGTPGDLDFFTRSARQSGGPVLLLLCGTGRVAAPLMRSGISVVGLDPEEAMIRLARRKLAQAGVNGALLAQGDPTRFVSDSKFSLVMIVDGGLQRLLTAEEQRACLDAARGAMRIGGKLLIDLPLFPATAPLPGEAPGAPLLRRFGASGERAALISRKSVHDPARQISEQLIRCDWLDAEGRVTEAEAGALRLRPLTPGEALLMLEVCGFAATAYGGYDRQPLGPESSRLVLEAERSR